MFWRRKRNRQTEFDDYTVEPIEPRVLLSADALGVDAGVLNPDDAAQSDWDIKDADNWTRSFAAHDVDDAAAVLANGDEADKRTEIVFLDAGVEDGQQLLADLMSRDGVSITQIHLIDSNSDGVDQIAQVLAGQQGIDAVHIISHGAAGQVQLGGGTLSTGSLDGYAGQLNDWGSALADSGDILFYGCDLAADEQGRALVIAIGALTGADVAASVDQTGHAAQGGDWDLEYRAGAVEARAFAPGAFQTWQGTLAAFTVDTTDDTVDANPGDGVAEDASGNTSLRAAIMEANVLAGADSIFLGADTYRLTISGSGDGAGDLDIRDDLSIVGISPTLTSIDGNSINRVLDVKDDASITVSISNLKIENGITALGAEPGGGLRVEAGANTPDVFLSNVWMAGSDALAGAFGGAIANHGKLTINNALIEGNTGFEGGGIWNAPTGVLIMHNVTLSGNDATDGDGGGLFNEGTATLRHVTITANSALGLGGGVIHDDGAIITDIGNSIIAGNNALGGSPDITSKASTITSAGGNIIQDATGSSGFAGGEIGINPLLGGLTDNGGDLLTHAPGAPAIDAANPALAPNTDQRGFLRDDGSPDIGAFEVGASATPATAELWLSTEGDVAAGGQSGDDSWNPGALIGIADPQLNLGPGTTSGTFATTFDGGLFATGGNLDAAHYVSAPIQIGSSNFQLLAGDLLLSIDSNGVVFTSNNSVALVTGFQASLNVNHADLFVFRPDSPGDYSEGQFGMLLQDVSAGQGLRGVTLVEQTLTVGGYVLQAGDFLYSRNGPGDDHSIWLYETGTTGVGATPVSRQEFLDGDDAAVGIQEQIHGIELIETTTEVGGQVLDAGTLLVNVDSAEAVGSNNLNVDRFDVFSLNVATSTLVGAGEATAQMLFDGSDVAFDANQEDLDALALAPPSAPPNVILDEFNTTSYSGSDGALPWAGDWQEIGEADGPDFGNVSVWNALGEEGLYMRWADNIGVWREADLSGFVSATLSFDWAMLQTELGDSASLQISTDGVVWDTLDTFDGPLNHSSLQSASYNISAYIDTDTRIRFETTFGFSANDVFFVDDVQISLSMDAYPVYQNAGPFNVDEGAAAGTTVGDIDADDGDGGAVDVGITYGITANLDPDGDSNMAFAIDPNTGVITVNDADDLDYEDASSMVITVEADDGVNTESTDVTINIDDVAPTLSATGAATVKEGGLYTLNLSAIEPGTDSISSWTIDWDDGSIETIAGNPSTVTHTYINTGFTNNITVSATDVGGTYIPGDMLVVSNATNSVFRFDADSAVFENEFADSNGLAGGVDVAIGPDGLVYVTGFGSNDLHRYDATTGTFVDKFAAGSQLSRMAFGPDGDLFLAAWSTDEVLRFDVAGGSFSTFIAAGGGTLGQPDGIAFGPDGKLYVFSGTDGKIQQYDGVTGAFLGTFVSTGTPGYSDILFGPNGNLYLSNLTANTIVEYDGITGADLGDFVSFGSGGISGMAGFQFGPDGDLYVADFLGDELYRYSGSDGSPKGIVVTAAAGMVQPINFVFTPAHQVTILANQAPVLGNNTLVLGEGDTVTLSATELSAADTDDVDSGLVFTVSGVSGGQFELTGDPGNPVFSFTQAQITASQVVFIHDGGETAPSYDVTVSDGADADGPAAATINYTPVNDNDPVADDESFTVLEGGTATEADLDAGTSLLSGDTDADLPNDTLTVNTTAVSGPSYGSLTLNADGTFSYTHDGSENFSDSFSYELLDADGGVSDTGTVTITITPQNDNDPVADDESFTVIEGGTATEADLDAGANLLSGDTDADLPNDTLTVNTTAVSGPSYGSLTLNTDGTFSYTHDGSENFSDSFSYELLDADGGVSDTGTVTITITPQNDNDPVADDESFTVTEGGTATEADLDVGTSLLDGDTDADLPNDTLTVNTTAVSGPSYGSLTLNADGTFSYTHDGSENFSDSFSYELLDADGGVSDTGTVTITITPQNDNDPVADDESFTVVEGGTATEADLDAGANLLSGDTDADLPNDTLTVNTTAVSGPSFGSLTLNADGTFSYTHDGSENFSDSFSYELLDADGGVSDTGTVTITITPQNDNDPVADDESFTVLEGGTATEADLDAGANLLSGDTDADLPNDTLTVNTTAVSGPSFGSLTLNADGTFSYTHDGSENFSDSFSYELLDADGGVSDTGTVTITITPQNDNDPVADDESFTVVEGGTATEVDLDAGTSLLSGDTDADLPNDTLTVNTTAVSGPSFGSLTLNADGTFSYTHDGSENFSDSFSYELLDADGGVSDTGTVTITITPQNDNDPVADDESFTVLEGGTATEADLDAGANLLSGDTDADLPNDTLTVNTTAVSGPSFGSLTLNADGTFSYTHDGSENFSDSFSYELLDADGGVSDTGTVTITITPQNDNDPVADDESFTVLEGGTATEADLDAGANLLSGDTDADLPNDTLTVNTTAVSGPSFGSLTLNADGTFSYTHDGSENFSDSFSYELLDADGGVSDTGTVTITITPQNDNDPVADDESFTVTEGGTATEADLDVGTSLLDGDTDADLPNDTLTVNTTAVSGPSYGSLTLNADGTFSYTHDGSENFSDSFSYELLDADGGVSDTGTVTITITPQNDNDPVADDESFTVVEGGTATEVDLDAGTSLLSGDTDADLPNDTLTVNTTAVSGPSFGSLTLNADGTFSYTHDGSENFSDSFSYELLDADGGVSDTGTVTITITPQNDNDPVADDESFTVLEGGTATEADLDAGANLLSGDTDADLPNDTLTVNTTAVSGPSFGSLTLNADGTFSYTHDGSENFSDSFSYELLDADGGVSDTGTVTITITPQNDNDPVADDESFTVLEGGTATEADLDAGANLLSGDTDADLPNDTLTVNTTAVSGPSFGSLTLNADGTFSYTHDGSENFSDSFSYELLDADGGVSDTGTVTITITPQNDEQVLAINTGTSVVEGSTGNTVMSAMLDTTDVDNVAIQVVYSMTTVPVNGTLYLSGTPLTAGNTFTQDDLDNNRVSYDHDGSATVSDSFRFNVDDGAGAGTTGTFAIIVTPLNDAPTLVNPIPDQLATEDAAFSFQFATATFNDPDTGDTLSYTAQQAGGTPLPGWLSFDAATRSFFGTPLNADVGALNIEVTATDGSGATATETFDLAIANVNDAPVLGNNQMTLGPGDNVVLTPAMLAASDVDHAAGGLQFSVSGVSGGQFELASASGVAITGFTQAQVVAGDVVFVDDGDTIAPTYSVTVGDTIASTGPAPATISFTLPTVTATVAPLAPTPVPDLTPEPTPAPVMPAPAAPPPDPTPEPEPEPEPDEEPEEEVVEELLVTGEPATPAAGSATERSSGGAVVIPDFNASTATNPVQGLLKSLLVRPAALTAMALPGAFEVDALAREVRSVLASSEFNSGLDRMREGVSDATVYHQSVVGSGVAVTTGLSVGYVAWLVRGGVLLSTALSSLPAWQFIDPLPVLARTRDDDDDGADDSLQAIIKEQSDRTANKARETANEIGADAAETSE